MKEEEHSMMKRNYIPPICERILACPAQMIARSTKSNNDNYDGSDKSGIPGGGENDNPNLPVESKPFAGGVQDWGDQWD